MQHTDGRELPLGVAVQIIALGTLIWIIGTLYRPYLNLTMLTGAVFYGVVTSFKKQWISAKFWIWITIIFSGHVAVLTTIFDGIQRMSYSKLAFVALLEGISLIFLMAVLLGGKTMLDVID